MKDPEILELKIRLSPAAVASIVTILFLSVSCDSPNFKCNNTLIEYCFHAQNYQINISSS